MFARTSGHLRDGFFCRSPGALITWPRLAPPVEPPPAPPPASPPSDVEDEDDEEDAESDEARAFRERWLENPGPFPERYIFDRLGGVLAEMVDYARRSQSTDFPEAALAASLATMGAVDGRRYHTETGLRTNVYTAVLAPSGSGKTNIVRAISELFVFDEHMQRLIGPDEFTSVTAMYGGLEHQPSMVCLLDEFGDLLQGFTERGAQKHVRDIFKALKRLFSDAGRSRFSAVRYADGREIMLSFPNLCLFGIATPDQFWRALGAANMEDGSLARFILIPQAGRAKRNETPDKSRAAVVHDMIADHYGFQPGEHRTGDVDLPDPLDGGARRVPNAPEVTAAFEALRWDCDAACEVADRVGGSSVTSLIKRIGENTMKIALISAISRDPREPREPRVEMIDFEIGQTLSEWSARAMAHKSRWLLVESEHEREVNRIRQIISEAGREGVTHRQIKRLTRRMDGRLREQILKDFDGVYFEAATVNARGRGRPGVRRRDLRWKKHPWD